MTKAEATTAANQRQLIGLLRIAFGLVWVLNIWFHLHANYLDNYLTGYRSVLQHGPLWLHPWLGSVVAVFQALGPHNVALVSVAIECVIALSLITGWLGRVGAWLGLVYISFLWSTLGAFGGPLTAGYTDPGPCPPYIIAFVLILELRAWETVRLSGDVTGSEGPPSDARYSATTGRLLFGALWAFEAYWKWQPYFIHHFLGFLTPAANGQPAWIAAYIHAIAGLVNTVGPTFFGILTAIVETLIATSLLTGRALTYGLALGVLWSLGIWTTAEGWGGPYGAGFGSSAMPGDIFGNAINYAFVFLLLAAAYRVRWIRVGAGQPSEEGAVTAAETP